MCSGLGIVEGEGDPQPACRHRDHGSGRGDTHQSPPEEHRQSRSRLFAMARSHLETLAIGILAYLDTGGSSNGGTESLTGLIELHGRLAGFRSRDNYDYTAHRPALVATV